MMRAFGLLTGLLLMAGALAPARADFSYSSTVTSDGLPIILPTSDVTQGGVLSLVSNSGSPTGSSSTVNLAYIYTTGLQGAANFTGSDGYVDKVTLTAGADSITWNITGNFAAQNSTYSQTSMNLVNTFTSATSFTSPPFADGTVLSLSNVTLTYPTTPPAGQPVTSGSYGFIQGTFSVIQGTPPSGGNTGNPGGTVQTPEPSALLLAGMGLSGVAAAAWRKRRKLVLGSAALRLA